MIFAAASSQSVFLLSPTSDQSIDFSRIYAFHMGEYIVLPTDAPQGFGNFFRQELFDKVRFAAVSCLNGNADDIAAECERYTSFLNTAPVGVVCRRSGENGHIAFNDPSVADHHFCIVPTALKANAVHDAVYGEIGECCPATAFRLCKNMTLYLDEATASKL